jgi:hypothetical protein
MIRPDGYVAFRAPGSDLRPLRAYLEATFISRAPSSGHRERGVGQVRTKPREV